MKRFFSTTLALFMVIALIMSFAAIPTSAATSYTPIGGTTTFTKNLVVEADANIPDLTFTYTIVRGTPVPATSSTIEILATAEAGATVSNAVFGNADTASATAGTPSDSTDTAHKYASKTVTVTFPNSAFTKPGVYRYVINEVDGQKPGVTYDTTARYLDVFVVADEHDVLSIQSCNLRTAATNIGLDGHYVTDPGVKSSGYINTVTQHDFSFSKAITGNQGDKNKRFTFTLSISNAIPGTYPIECVDVSGNPTTITIGTDGTYTGTYDLTDGSSLKVKSLNNGAVCTVSEDAQDYAPSHTVDGGSTVGTANSGTITLDGDHTVAFTNNRNGIVPTGVLMTVAPFAIGLLLFGAIAFFLISKKRRED